MWAVESLEDDVFFRAGMKDCQYPNGEVRPGK
jgi:hypothetical protein